MTSCGDDAPVLGIPGTKWSHPETFPLLSCASSIANLASNPTNSEPLDQTDNAALKQRLEAYWAQVLCYQQNKAHMNKATGTTEQHSNVEEAKRIMQQLIVASATQPPVTMSWPGITNQRSPYTSRDPPPLIPMSPPTYTHNPAV
uniref:Uncharacterized protein n=1 Tax=Ciona savignyi TaxID=51511 RepID=H2ZI62_CIOSA